MVIRGRRVNRCDTCTRRKVKCDQGRPECQRCRKSGLQCEGYSLNLVIVGPKHASQSAHNNPGAWKQNSEKSTPQGESQQRLIRPKSRPQILCLQMKEEAVLTAHLLARFTPSSDVEPSAPATLLPLLIKMDGSYSARALAAIYFGKMRNQYQIYRKGTQLYGKALDQLCKAISDPVTAQSNETLTSVLCLCVYEHVVLSETTAWLKHYQGLGRLVEYRGPQRQQTELEKRMFRMCRFMIIIAAGVTKSHCFLAQERWKSRRVQAADASDDSIDRLYDTMAEVPGLFHDMDQLDYVAAKTSKTNSYVALRDRAARLLRELCDWPSTVLDDGDEAAGLPPKTQAVAAALAKCYASILSLATATDYFDLPLLTPTNLRSGADESEELALQKSHKFAVRRLLACEICHIGTATLKGKQCTSTAFFFIFSLQVAHAHLDPQTPEGMRLEGLLDFVIADKHGFESGRTRKWAAVFNSPPV